MENCLRKIVAQETFTRNEAKEIMHEIVDQKYSDMQIAAILMGIQTRGVTVYEILGLRDGLLETGVHTDMKPYQVIDIVGTGGDGKNTFNISTCSCFVVAGAGYKVAKHGNYAALSVSGASNVLEAHGVKFTADNDALKRSLEECGFVHQHAQLFAKGMKWVGPARKALGQLGTPSCFNLLGPLVNPCNPDYQLLGTANLDQQRLYHQVYQRIGIKYGIVTSIDGYDEISLTGSFKIVYNEEEHVYQPEEFGMQVINPKEIYGGSTLEEAKEIFDAVLENRSTLAQKNVVLINSAFAIHVIEQQKTFNECLSLAKESLESGRALQCLKKYIELNS